MGISGNSFPHGYEKLFLSKVPRFREVDNCLRFMDDSSISLDVLLDAISDEFGDKSEAERFRWDLAIHRRCTSQEIEDSSRVKTLTLSGFNLSYALLSWFPALIEVDLSHNAIHLSHLQDSGLDRLKELRILNLAFNEIAHPAETSCLLSKLQSLEVLDLTGNKCLPDNSRRQRINFLKHWDGIASHNFHLISLSGHPVSSDERIEAVSGVFNSNDAYRVQFEVVLSDSKIQSDDRELVLSGKELVLCDGLRRFTRLTKLVLAKNRLKSLSAQCLEFLPELSYLDIRDNAIESVSDIWEGLSRCHCLEILFIQDASTDGETKMSSRFVPIVGSYLRGVKHIDDRPNPHILSSVQKEAKDWLLAVAGIGPNSLVSVDISLKNLEADLYFMILAALSEMGCVKHFRASGNLWNKGKDRLRAYRQYAIHALKTLETMDGEEILDAERLNAIELVEDEEKQGIHLIYRGGWIEARDDAHEILPQIQKERESKKKVDDAGFLDLGGNPLARKIHGGDAAKLQQTDWMKMKQHADAILVEQQAKAITGSLLTKLEVLINFLQLYAITLSLDFNIPWPPLYLKWIQWIKIFSFDIDFLFRIDLPYQQEIKLASIIAMPLVFLLLYHYSTKLNLNKWKLDYGEKWQNTRSGAFMFLCLGVIASILIGIAVDPTSIDRFKQGSGPSPKTASVILVSALILTFIFVSWYTFARSFRKNFIGQDEEQFTKWWFRRLYLVRRLCLFMITILFMPVCRLIVLQFQCTTDEFGNRYLYAYKDRWCPDVKLYPIQVVSLIFGILYILGLPLFFRRLIRTAVKMVDSHGYRDEAAIYSDAIKREAEVGKDKSSRELKRIKQEAQDHLRRFYANEVRNNPMPQTYLFGAYERRFRYYKIFQMLQKVFVVLITVFLPSAAWASLRVILGTCLVGSFAFLSMVFTPFNDALEDMMDIMSHCTNFLNIGVALLLQTRLVDKFSAGLVLVLVNATIMFLLILLIIGIPLRAYLARKQSPKYERLASPSKDDW